MFGPARTKESRTRLQRHLKGRYKLCRYKECRSKRGVWLEVGEKYFKSKCRLAGLILSLNAMNCFKFELQFKFRNTNLSFITVNFRTYLP